MESQNNNIDKYFKKISEETQPENFQGMENIWNRVENKLDENEKNRAFPLWKYAGIAASILVLIGVGSIFLKNDPANIIQHPEPTIVSIEEDSINDESITYTEIEEFVPEGMSQEETKREEKVVSEITSDSNQLQEDIYNAIAISELESEGISERTVSVQKETEPNLNVASVKKATDSKVSVKTITGTVTDYFGLPLPGVNIIVKNSTIGTQTDFDGNYAIQAFDGQTLVYSYVGFETQERDVLSSTKTIDIEMQYGEELQQVVVTGYKIRNRKVQTSSVVTISEEVTRPIISRPNTNQPLQGKVQGVKVIHNENDQESYAGFIENPFEGASYNPVSTFSIDVDNASYTNIRRFINNGQTVPKDAVRIEEMINFFKYDYPQPKSKHPFTINTEYSDAPWNPNHKLLKIGLKGKDIPTDKLPKSNFVFLVDVSGSMNSPNRLPLVKSSLKILLEELRDDDLVSIVYYANNVGVLLEPTKASEKEKIIEVIDQMRASGGTSGGAGIELAYEMAEKNFIKGGNNRIILATDGDFNIGRSSDEEMLKLIEEKRKSGVFLTCLGYGMGNYKDSKMEILANKGNGNYAYIDNIQEANRFLSKEFKGSMFTIAKDVKIQIEFNPKHVQAYRLIGYENRKLRNEDFTNDAIDAGELGSGHTVTAFYEIIPVGVNSEFYENDLDLKYTQNTSKSNDYADELATVKFRYKKPDGKNSIEMVHPITKNPVKFENASKDFKFASAVAWFGLKLRDSKLVSNKKSEEILKLAREGLHNDTDGYKAEFIRLVESVK
jgi:Ca-activated chloride channel family protein